jgi:hypothetical protein
MKIRSTSSKTLFGYPYCNKKRVFNKKQKLWSEMEDYD